MQKIVYSEAARSLRCLGRTWSDGAALHFNWTCSGFELRFTGRFLAAQFRAGATMEAEGTPQQQNMPEHAVWPWIGIVIDGEAQPSRRVRCVDNCTEVLFSSKKPETHTVRVVKLTENLKTFLALEGFLAEGELLTPPSRAERSIEFIGDSITCGFGNEIRDKDRYFFSEDENGWLSHGAIAARALGMDWNMISISGICLSKREALPMAYAMDEIYRFTDRPGQERAGRSAKVWDFENNKRDCVVLNLGTNDANAASMSEEPEAVETRFGQDYVSFLKTLRQCNGPSAHLICAMGSMDYYLYDKILRAVEEYRRESGDTRISTLKYMRISPLDPLGAMAHPHVQTQEKMASALVKHIRQLEEA